MKKISVPTYKISQKVKKEYGRLSALPHHLPSKAIDEVDDYICLSYPYVITGSAFQFIDGENVYVTRGDYTVKEGIVELDEDKIGKFK